MPDTHTTASEVMNKSAIRAYLGGSFNPVHNSHIQMAMHVYNSLLPIAAEQQRELHVSLLPNARSPFKQQSTDPADRMAMLKLAIQNTPLQIDELELWQMPPVYTIDSVRTLRRCYPDDSLIFIMGMDSARSLEKWKEGLQLTDYVHLWIFDRNEHSDIVQSIQTNRTKQLTEQEIAYLRHELPIELQTHITNLPTDLMQPLNATLNANKPQKANQLLKNSAQGRIYIDQRQVTAVSSTNIRKQIYQQLQTGPMYANNVPDKLVELLNPAVYHYIIAHQLYSAL